MRITKRQLRRVIRESILNEMSFRDMRDESSKRRFNQRTTELEEDMPMDNHAACVKKCFAAVPPMMKKMCGMGMAHMVTNDIYHLCAPICEQMGCDCDKVSAEVQQMCAK